MRDIGNWVRNVGLLFLLVGFGWLASQQFNVLIGASLRSVGLAQHAKLSTDDRCYTPEDVKARIRDTALAVNARFPPILLPGAVMLVGGLLLAVSGRRRVGQDVA